MLLLLCRPYRPIVSVINVRNCVLQTSSSDKIYMKIKHGGQKEITSINFEKGLVLPISLL